MNTTPHVCRMARSDGKGFHSIEKELSLCLVSQIAVPCEV